MFAEDEIKLLAVERLIPALLVILLLLVAGGAWLWARRRSRSHSYLQKV